MGLFWQSKAPYGYGALAERLDTIERSVKALQLDWDTAYDKLRHMMGRVSKRAALAEKLDHESAALPDSPAPGAQVVNGRALSDRQFEIQRQILRQRGGG